MREFGVRMALGATPRRLMSSVMSGGARLVGTGIALGVAGALAVGRVISSLLYGLPATDGLTLASAIVLFAVVAAAACWLPARRASRVDPAMVLHGE
jgi:ABC-type antimicrobial peptide transport system permease subunit